MANGFEIYLSLKVGTNRIGLSTTSSSDYRAEIKQSRKLEEGVPSHLKAAVERMELAEEEKK